jgi:hypothetical protein
MTHIVERDSVQPPPRHSGAHPAVVTGDTARQAPRGKRVLYILATTLVLVALAFAALYIVSFGATT